jgi:ABC-type transporter Mla maintaining outer membrane lipid asymmetry permease subunit MlaE
MSRTGADTVSIVALLTFLIGFVSAFQATVQLKQFRARIYVAEWCANSRRAAHCL